MYTHGRLPLFCNYCNGIKLLGTEHPLYTNFAEKESRLKVIGCLFPLLDVTSPYVPVFKAAWRSLVIAPADGAVIRVCAKDTMSNCSSVFKSSQNGQKGLLHFLNHIWSAGPGHSNLCAAISQIPKNPSISFWSLAWTTFKDHLLSLGTY